MGGSSASAFVDCCRTDFRLFRRDVPFGNARSFIVVFYGQTSQKAKNPGSGSIWNAVDNLAKVPTVESANVSNLNEFSRKTFARFPLPPDGKCANLPFPNGPLPRILHLSISTPALRILKGGINILAERGTGCLNR
jgi:hypothetical protein